METWTVVGVDTQASEKNKTTGETITGVKYHVYGSNFDFDQSDRYLGDCVSVIFLSHADRERLQYDASPGQKIRVAYNRWGKVILFEPA